MSYDAGEVIVSSPGQGDFYLFCAEYEGVRLKKVQMLPISFDSAGRKEYTLQPDASTNEIQLMLWNDLGSIKPLCDTVKYDL